LSSWVYDKALEAVRKTVLVSLLSWFVLDSSGSIASGNTPNALLNILVVLIAVRTVVVASKKLTTTCKRKNHHLQLGLIENSSIKRSRLLTNASLNRS
jgi:hypothetical protein